MINKKSDLLLDHFSVRLLLRYGGTSLKRYKIITYFSLILAFFLYFFKIIL